MRIIVITLVLISSLSGGKMQKKERNPLISLASQEADFGLKLFQELRREQGNRNIFISPLSISMALSMTLNGAAGETETAMKRALGFEGIALDEVNKSYHELREALQHPDSGIKIEIANAIWGRMQIKYKQEFISNDKEFYGAELKLIKFNETTPHLINEWVKAKTRGKIMKIVDRIDPNTIMFLVNAIYFKGVWTTAFDKKKTREGEFTTPDGKKIKVEMMRKEGHFNHLKGAKFEAVSLPYGKKRNISMFIFLPDEGSNLDEFYATLLNYKWEYLFKQFRSAKGEIYLPRFKMEYGAELKDALTSLGMGDAFDQSRANFTNLCFSKERVYLEGVRHKSFIEVNEEGTEAAAVTSVRVGITAVPEMFRMVVDRPFFFVIRDNRTGAILFMGEVTNPKKG